MADPDAIIIGSGHNALCAALYLVEAGWRVLILEQSSEIGGGLRTAALTGAGYRHDLYATNVGAFLASPVQRDFGEALAQTGLTFLRHDRPFASAFADGRSLPVFSDPARTAGEISAFSSRDSERWHRTAELFGRIGPHILSLPRSAMPSMKAAGHLLPLLARPSDAVRAARLAIMTCGGWTREMFETPEVRALLTPWAFHTDLGPDDPGGAAFAFIAAFSAAQHGMVVPQGGAGALSDALANVLRARGAQIMVGTKIARIDIRDGVATAVRTASGERFVARRAVVAGIAPSALIDEMLPSDTLPTSAARLRNFVNGPATFVLHLALRDALQWRAREDLSQFFYVHLNGEPELISATLRQAKQGLIPDRPMIIVGQPTVVDPTRAPAGHHVARLHVRCVPRIILGDVSGTIVERDWAAAAGSFTQRLLSLLSEHVSNLDNVLHDHAWMSPEDIERDNPNMSAGDCSGGSHHLRQHYFLRPALGWSRHRTPIRNLYLTGAATWPGAGIHGHSGYLAAQEILTQSNR